MLAILGLEIGTATEPEVALVHHGRRIERRRGSPAKSLPAGDSAQLGVDVLVEALVGLGGPGARILQQLDETR